MFINLSKPDILMISRGLVVLVVVIMVGVAAAETQLNSLTHQHEFAQSFCVRRDRQGVYSAYIFGNGGSVSAVYQIAEISNKREIIVDAAGYRVIIPTRFTLDYKEVLTLIKLWYKQFITEALNTKRTLERYMTEVYREADEYIRQFR